MRAARRELKKQRVKKLLGKESTEPKPQEKSIMTNAEFASSKGKKRGTKVFKKLRLE